MSYMYVCTYSVSLYKKFRWRAKNGTHQMMTFCIQLTNYFFKFYSAEFINPFSFLSILLQEDPSLVDWLIFNNCWILKLEMGFFCKWNGKRHY